MGKLGKQEQIRQSFIGLELKALSMLLSKWAESGKKTSAKKLQELRNAMMTETGKGGKEQAPFEVVIDEYDVMFECVELIKKNGVAKSVDCIVDGAVVFNRPFWSCPRKLVHSL